MNKKLSLTICILWVTIVSAMNLSGQTGKTTTFGTLTFTVKSVTNNSTYSPKNVLAIWIADSNGTFVKSCKVMAASRKKHLVKWNINSAGNTVSAVTGATLSNHQTHTIAWDGTNVAGTVVPDGTYKVCVEYTSTNSLTNGNAGPYLTVDFFKGASSQHITPANATYYQAIVADWIPSLTGYNTLEKAGSSVNIFPNPFTSNTNISLQIDKRSQVSMVVFDMNGQKLFTIAEDILNAGLYQYTWDARTDSGAQLLKGVYFIKISVNGCSEMRKVILN